MNSNLSGNQGQPDVAYGPNGISAVAWAGDGDKFPQDNLDVFVRFVDTDGVPLSVDIRANSQTAARQDQPQVRFLPKFDAQGNPIAVVTWRDTQVDQFGNPTDVPNGTGTGYRCFSIPGANTGPVDSDNDCLSDEDEMRIGTNRNKPDTDGDNFLDGIESGDTTSWYDVEGKSP